MSPCQRKPSWFVQKGQKGVGRGDVATRLLGQPNFHPGNWTRHEMQIVPDSRSAGGKFVSGRLGYLQC
jgi:hypothetical protein